MQLDAGEVVRFLNLWSPEGPWVLTAIRPDRKAIETRTLKLVGKALEWLQGHSADRNLYFSVNPLRHEVDKKPDREDVAALAWLHVDVDPRAGEDLALEQARILALLRAPPGGVPPPTGIAFSGGGYQGFWKLKAPFPIDGQQDKYLEAARYNLQLELIFGADSCHNVDRIMRVPGTVNWPDEAKKRKGRKPALARIEQWNLALAYDLSQFTPAPRVQKADAVGFGGGIIQVSGNVRRLASVDELNGVSDRAKVVIVQGLDPDEPKKYPSRSEWLFYVCCEMVRAGVDNDTIYAVITDPGFGISASVLDKGGSAEKYALRQIERAREEGINPWLRKLNESHAVIGDVGGRCKVISEVPDPSLGRSRLSLQSFDDIRNRYMNVMVQVGTNGRGDPIHKPLGKWWLEHPQRRQFEIMTFAPGMEVNGAFNLWRGFACDARPGKCDLFLGHVRDIICNGQVGYYEYLLSWMALAVQSPNHPGETAVVLRGPQGTGKSFFAKMFGSLFGRHFLQVGDPKHLVGSFNAHLRDCVLLLGDEAFYAGDKKHESVLKLLITEEMIAVEGKGRDVEFSSNCVHLILASNEQWVVPAGLDDRRFFVLDVSEKVLQKGEHFEAIRCEMNKGGREALLHFLLTRDVKQFDPRRAPQTDALRDQKLHSLDPQEEWWYTKLFDGKLLPQHPNWTARAYVSSLLYDYASTLRGQNAVNHRSTPSRLGRFLQRACPPGWPRKKQSGANVELPGPDGRPTMMQRPYYYLLPPLVELRAWWDAHFGGPYAWPTVEPEPDDAPVDNTPF